MERLRAEGMAALEETRATDSVYGEAMVAIQEKVNAGMDANIEKMVACL
jgi:hypothetical protein